MQADAPRRPPRRSAGDTALRRVLAGLWGVALAGVLFLPSLSFTEGFAFAEVETPAARYQRLVLGVAGATAILGALRGTRVWGWVMLAALPLLLGLALWERVEPGGAWWASWWRPVLGVALVGVPAWLLLGRPEEPGRRL